jgi:uncharacterized protein (DUF1330 family)
MLTIDDARRARLVRALWRSGLITIAIAAGAACASSSSDEPTASPTPATTIDRLAAAYSDAKLDPSRDAWQALLDDPAFDEPISVVEFVHLKPGDDARASYDAFVDALQPAATAAGGEVLSVNDILMPGLEGLEGYGGGVSWIATFPAISAYVETMLDERVVAAAEQRRAAVAEAQVLAGPDLIPPNIKQLPPNEPASAFPSDRVKGKRPAQVVDEVLAVYPSGGADPTRATLEAMTTFGGWQAQRVHFINLYRFNDAPGGGATALGEYNAGALPYVLAHGGRPKVLANVTHHLVGPTAWDRFIYVSWPSLAVFTDLRLEPGYIEAQKDRVMSAEQYGNLITIARADQPQASTE